jgi:hypothetical protein
MSTPISTVRTRRSGSRWTICPGCTAVLTPLVAGDHQHCRFCDVEFMLVPPKPPKRKAAKE